MDTQQQAPITPYEARAIAKDAYIYGFPLVDSYRLQHSYFVDREDPEFKAPWNAIHNTLRVYTPEDTAIQTPNSDTPYSQLGADLRAEPLVLTMPAARPSRVAWLLRCRYREVRSPHEDVIARVGSQVEASARAQIARVSCGQAAARRRGHATRWSGSRSRGADSV